MLNPPAIDTSRHPLARGYAPGWASGWGQDEYGVFTEFTVDEVTQRMRWIPPGRFLMGSPETEMGRYSKEGPQHEVTIAEGFWLGDTPCAQALWTAVMDDNPSIFRTPDRPVESVSFDDVQSFLQRFNEHKDGPTLQLVSEAQWEYACRAGAEQGPFAGSIDIQGDANAPALDPIAWYAGNSGVGFDLDNGQELKWATNFQYPGLPSGTHPVGRKMPNPWGLKDMLGNVFEWCADSWHENYENAPTDGSAWGEEYGDEWVIRGGSWYDGARYARPAAREKAAVGDRRFGVGFRFSGR